MELLEHLNHSKVYPNGWRRTCGGDLTDVEVRMCASRKKKGFLLGKKKNCCCTKTEFIFYLIDKRRRLWSKVTSVATSQTDRLKKDRRLPSLHIKHVFFFSLSISNSRTLTVSIHITGAPPIWLIIKEIWHTNLKMGVPTFSRNQRTRMTSSCLSGGAVSQVNSAVLLASTTRLRSGTSVWWKKKKENGSIEYTQSHSIFLTGHTACPAIFQWVSH